MTDHPHTADYRQIYRMLLRLPDDLLFAQDPNDDDVAFPHLADLLGALHALTRVLWRDEHDAPILDGLASEIDRTIDTLEQRYDDALGALMDASETSR